MASIILEKMASGPYNAIAFMQSLEVLAHRHEAGGYPLLRYLADHDSVAINLAHYSFNDWLQDNKGHVLCLLPGLSPEELPRRQRSSLLRETVDDEFEDPLDAADKVASEFAQAKLIMTVLNSDSNARIKTVFLQEFGTFVTTGVKKEADLFLEILERCSQQALDALKTAAGSEEWTQLKRDKDTVALARLIRSALVMRGRDARAATVLNIIRTLRQPPNQSIDDLTSILMGHFEELSALGKPLTPIQKLRAIFTSINPTTYRDPWETYFNAEDHDLLRLGWTAAITLLKKVELDVESRIEHLRSFAVSPQAPPTRLVAHPATLPAPFRRIRLVWSATPHPGACSHCHEQSKARSTVAGQGVNDMSHLAATCDARLRASS